MWRTYQSNGAAKVSLHTKGLEMSVYLRNGIITLIINAVIFLIGWGCIVPDQLLDNTHLFGLLGDVEVIKGNTAVVFGMCAVLSLLTLIVGMVEAIIEDYQPRFCPTRNERPRKPQKFEAAGMRIADPSPAKEDPKTPTLS
jgi:hypothetical protein